MSENYKNFLEDFGYWLKEESLKAKKKLEKIEAKSGKDSAEYHFADGVVSTYYGIVSYIHQQAEHFDLDLKLLHLDGIDPDKDLI